MNYKLLVDSGQSGVGGAAIVFSCLYTGAWVRGWGGTQGQTHDHRRTLNKFRGLQNRTKHHEWEKGTFLEEGSSGGREIEGDGVRVTRMLLVYIHTVVQGCKENHR